MVHEASGYAFVERGAARRDAAFFLLAIENESKVKNTSGSSDEE